MPRVSASYSITDLNDGSSVHFLNTSLSYTQAQLESLGQTPGSWALANITSDHSAVRVGDVCWMRCTNTTKNGYTYVGLTVSSITTTNIVGGSTGLGILDKGDQGVQGAQGPQGVQGAAGANGQNGADGVGIASIAYTYATSETQTGTKTAYSNSIPPLSNTAKFLWQKEVITYTDTNTKVTEAIIGVYGDKGQDGTNGQDGRDGVNGRDGRD